MAAPGTHPEGFRDGAPRVVVADPIHPAGIERLRAGAVVDVATGLTAEALRARLSEANALVIRSETRVTAELLAAAPRLQVIARAGVGVDNVDVPAATQRGIIVVNSPEGNTIAAAEHTVAMMLALSRKIPAAAWSLRAGEWRRSAFVGVEVYNKTLGIIGFGKVGREVARRAQGLGMRVIAHDLYVSVEQAQRENVELVELDELLASADYISLHAPLTRDTINLLDRDKFARMKDGVRIINCARGKVINETALLEALESGKVAGAALDVFAKEPPGPDNPLLKQERVIGTPHLGASTEEAQINVALDIAEQVLAVLDGRPPRSAVNMPGVSPEVYARIEPYLRLATQIGRLHAQLSDGAVRSVQVTYSGDVLNLDTQPITRAVLIGLLQPVLAQPVNFVNAPFIAESRGIRVTESKAAGEEEYPNRIVVEVEDARRRRKIAGTVLSKRDIRIREIDSFRIDLEPSGYMLIARHTDRPGIIGRVGTLLGKNNINIGGMLVGREAVGQRAMMVLTVDDPIPEPLLAELAREIATDYVRFVEL
ncbi:MAG: phosphoglycerate dehydrogenase [Armatimonadetes bacterium]|nr:phosphoglycerate dehydrogenase [Armatimonadota bacterium]